MQEAATGVNTEQPTVQGVLSEQQIESLPVNGRNFLELAQLDSGVQIQDAEFGFGFKDGFSSISFRGRFGRTARIEVDGIHISEEKLDRRLRIFGKETPSGRAVASASSSRNAIISLPRLGGLLPTRSPSQLLRKELDSPIGLVKGDQ